ncbi:sulfurtransferase [Nocardioides solisilvae]|uniref:sulfurtransferase n=1 Tax=Nocardioides solisilvae TaxID=1542435 RepID=UPI00195241F9|nr:sulfurtransferase [Nocardioides solisilvae]
MTRGVGGPLVAPEELVGLLGAVTVLDVRYRTGATDGQTGRPAWLAGHVPGSAYVDLDTALAGPAGASGRHPLPDPEVFAAAMRAAGVHAERPVVVLDDWQGRAAARAWWLLRLHGHRDVQVLDGGLAAWRRAGGPLVAGETDPEDLAARPPLPGDFTPGPGDGMPWVEAGEVPGVGVLVDARAPERYRGDVEPIDPVAGHVPGARNVPTDANLGPDGRFRPGEELAALYADIGAVPGADVAAYCGSGVTATHDVLAMELAGVRAALYPGSWSGWVSDPSRPVERSVPSA